MVRISDNIVNFFSKGLNLTGISYLGSSAINLRHQQYKKAASDAAEGITRLALTILTCAALEAINSDYNNKPLRDHINSLKPNSCYELSFEDISKGFGNENGHDFRSSTNVAVDCLDGDKIVDFCNQLLDFKTLASKNHRESSTYQPNERTRHNTLFVNELTELGTCFSNVLNLPSKFFEHVISSPSSRRNFAKSLQQYCFTTRLPYSLTSSDKFCTVDILKQVQENSGLFEKLVGDKH